MSSRRTWYRLLALGGVAGPVLFALVLIIAGAIRTDYSHISQFISELGATGTAHAGLMNYAGFIPGGLGIAAFGLAVGRLLPVGKLTRAASILLTIFGAGVFASGLISCDPGCPQVGGTLENAIHDKIAPVSFLCAIVATALVGLQFRRDPARRSDSWYSLVTSAATLAFLMALVNSLETRDLTGLWQRLLVGTLFTWAAVIAYRTYRTAGMRPAS